MYVLLYYYLLTMHMVVLTNLNVARLYLVLPLFFMGIFSLKCILSPCLGGFYHYLVVIVFHCVYILYVIFKSLFLIDIILCNFCVVLYFYVTIFPRLYYIYIMSSISRLFCNIRLLIFLVCYLISSIQFLLYLHS